MQEDEIVTFDMLLNNAKKYIAEENIGIIEKSYEFASKIHSGTKRLSGEDYISHPLNVAYILTKIHSDYEALSAALLHEVLKTGNTSYSVLESEFGTDIATLVRS